jgi:hypothetical protein
LVSDVEEMSGCSHNASGAYGSVCVELESDALAVCALLQAHHVLHAEGTSTATAFAAHHHSIQDSLAATGTLLHRPLAPNQHTYLELLPSSEGTLSRWSRLHLQSLAPTNPHWDHVVVYGPSSLCVIHKKGMCPMDINRLMKMNTENNGPHVSLCLVRCPGQIKE